MIPLLPSLPFFSPLKRKHISYCWQESFRSQVLLLLPNVPPLPLKTYGMFFGGQKYVRVTIQYGKECILTTDIMWLFEVTVCHKWRGYCGKHGISTLLQWGVSTTNIPHIWKHTVEKRKTNATSVRNMALLLWRVSTTNIPPLLVSALLCATQRITSIFLWLWWKYWWS